MPKSKEKLFVAVVIDQFIGGLSGRPDGDWASFVGHDKTEVVEHAIKARDKWQTKGFGPYRILVGSLSGEITVPVSYEEVAI